MARDQSLDSYSFGGGGGFGGGWSQDDLDMASDIASRAGRGPSRESDSTNRKANKVADWTPSKGWTGNADAISRATGGKGTEAADTRAAYEAFMAPERQQRQYAAEQRGRDMGWRERLNPVGGIGDFMGDIFSGNFSGALDSAGDWLGGGVDRMPGIVSLMPGAIPGVGLASGWFGDKTAAKHADVAEAIRQGEDGYWQGEVGGQTVSFHPGMFGSTVMTGNPVIGEPGRPLSIEQQIALRNAMDSGGDYSAPTNYESSDQYEQRQQQRFEQAEQEREQRQDRQTQSLERAVAASMGPFQGNMLRYGIDYGEHQWFEPDYLNWDID